MISLPELRIRRVNKASMDPAGGYVLYWMTAFRRLGWNHALQHAAGMARALNRPLVILEILLTDYPYVSPRFHRFMLEGMGERSRHLEDTFVFHYPFVERESGDSDGLFASLAAHSCSVVVGFYRPSTPCPR